MTEELQQKINFRQKSIFAFKEINGLKIKSKLIRSIQIAGLHAQLLSRRQFQVGGNMLIAMSQSGKITSF